MAERILVIGKGATQQLSPDIMNHFQEVKLIISGDQSSMPIQVVSQLLMLQQQCSLKIDFLQLQAGNDEEYHRILAFQLGVFLMDPENEVALLSNDPSIDCVIEYGKNLGFKIQRMEGNGSVSMASMKPQPKMQQAMPQPQPQPMPQAAPQPAAAPQQAAAPQPKSTNKKLISTLIGGSVGLMGGGN
jgi:hypothetical protein